MIKKILAFLLSLAASWGFSFAKEPVVDWDNTIFTPLHLKLTTAEGTLLLSDSPEYVSPTGGVLYRDEVIGNGRVYFYHVNQMEAPHKIGLVLTNKSFLPNQITVHRKLMAKPTPDYFAVGRELSEKELSLPKRLPESFMLKRGEKILLYSDLEKVPVYKDELFSGIVDFASEGPAEVSVMMLPMDVDTKEVARTIKILPHDEVHLRGTYEKAANRRFIVEPVYDVSLGAAALELTNDEDDLYAVGVDVLSDHEVVTNRGNYGIASTIDLATKGKGQYKLFFNTLGGAYAGAMGITYKGKEVIKELPAKNKPYMGHETLYDTVYLGTYEGGQSLQLRYMPAGASNLPVRLLLIPLSREEEQAFESKKAKKQDAKKKLSKTDRSEVNANSSVGTAKPINLRERLENFEKPV